MNPISSLLKSRKFLLLVLDTVVSLSLYFVGKYLQVAEADLKFLVAALQPVFVVIIGAIAYEDANSALEIDAELEVGEDK